MAGPKLITDFPIASGLSSSLLMVVGDPNTGVLYRTTLANISTSIGTQSGPQGYQGPQGFQGSTGSRGLQGFQGFMGITGQGLQGSQGIIGVTGSQGSQGTAGATGTGFSRVLVYTILTSSPTYSLVSGPIVPGTTGLVEVNVAAVDSAFGFDFISGKKVARYFYSSSGTFSIGPISDILPTERSNGFTGATWSIISNGLSSVLVRLIGTATASVKWIVDYKYIEVTGDF